MAGKSVKPGPLSRVWCSVTLSLKGRRRLGSVLVILHIAMTVGAVIPLFAGYFIYHNMALFNSFVFSVYSSWFPQILLVAGALLVAIHLFSIPVCRTLGNWRAMYRSPVTWQMLMAACLYLTLFLAALLAYIAIVSGSQGDKLRNAYKLGLQHAMLKYKTDSSAKLIVDRIQLSHECCGADSYTDWFNVAWVGGLYINEMTIKDNTADSVAGETRNVKADEARTLASVPTSCCSVRANRPCIDTDMTDGTAHYNYNPRSDVTVHPVGCVDTLTQLTINVIITNVAKYAVVAVAAELCIIFIFRIVQTSADAAIQDLDPTEESVGFLCTTSRAPAKKRKDWNDVTEQLDTLDNLYQMTDEEIGEQLATLKRKRDKRDKAKQQKSQQQQQQQTVMMPAGAGTDPSGRVNAWFNNYYQYGMTPMTPGTSALPGPAAAPAAATNDTKQDEEEEDEDEEEITRSDEHMLDVYSKNVNKNARGHRNKRRHGPV